MNSTNVDRHSRKIRRTGRHTTPSQVEKVAEKAGKAAPVVVIAGAMVATPAAQAAVKAPARAATVTEQTVTGQVRTETRTDALVRKAEPAARSYTVRSGDSLSMIAERLYGSAAHWQWIYEANRSKISDPNAIYVGESLTIPYRAPSTTSYIPGYAPKHAKPKAKAVVLTSTTSLSGTLGCAGLETLWEEGGGSAAEAFTAAEIAMAESGGRQYALSPTNDYGYWQINGSHGPAQATFNPLGNARAAVAISNDGNDWGPWTTYTSGAYRGRC
ncbi:MAG: LysM peptidoglycan-binding domain-containing protein [Actinomycetota bacterium]|nr:LysM peptidoglycan-binding domain-containing protein [Actinomycetota bacterium]